MSEKWLIGACRWWPMWGRVTDNPLPGRAGEARLPEKREQSQGLSPQWMLRRAALPPPGHQLLKGQARRCLDSGVPKQAQRGGPQLPSSKKSHRINSSCFPLGL